MIVGERQKLEMFSRADDAPWNFLDMKTLSVRFLQQIKVFQTSWRRENIYIVGTEKKKKDLPVRIQLLCLGRRVHSWEFSFLNTASPLVT